MTKEQILEKMIEEMPFTLPTACLPYIKEAMDIFSQQELAKERERAAKLYKVLKHINFGIDLAASHNANYVIETADVNLIKQSLTEYEKS